MLIACIHLCSAFWQSIMWFILEPLHQHISQMTCACSSVLSSEEMKRIIWKYLCPFSPKTYRGSGLAITRTSGKQWHSFHMIFDLTPCAVNAAKYFDHSCMQSVAKPSHSTELKVINHSSIRTTRFWFSRLGSSFNSWLSQTFRSVLLGSLELQPGVYFGVKVLR